MMKLGMLAVPALLLAGGLSCAVDLTPRFAVRIAAGAVIRRPYFVDEDKIYTVTLPSGTEVRADDRGALFEFQKLEGATLRVQNSPQTPKLPFSVEGMEVYRALAQRFVPSEATGLSIEKEVLDPFPINGWTSCGFTLSYSLSGRVFRQAAVFLNLGPSQQIVVRTSASAKCFEEAVSLSWDILRSWRPVEQGENLGSLSGG